MPARRTVARHSAASLVATTLVIAAFVGVTVFGCSHGTARAAVEPTPAVARTP